MRITFLKYFALSAIIGLPHIACKKSSMVAPTVDYKTLKVLEFQTNTPIADAEVNLFKCNRPNSWGCLESSVVGTLHTDRDGNFQFDSKLNVYLIGASHLNYFDGTSGGNFSGLGYIYLTPVAYTKIHLRKTYVHPPELLLHISLDRDVLSFYSFGIQGSYNQADDTTVVMKSYGNNKNTINWFFTDKAGIPANTETGGQIPAYYINRFDTASVNIDF